MRTTSLDSRLIESVAADLEAIASQLGSPHETLANRITNIAKLLMNLGFCKSEINPAGLDDHPSVADQLWTDTFLNTHANLIKPTPHKHGCQNEPGLIGTSVLSAPDRDTADRIRTSISSKHPNTNQNEPLTGHKPTNASHNYRADSTTPLQSTPSASENKRSKRLRSRIPVLTKRLSKTMAHPNDDPRPHTQKRPRSDYKMDTKNNRVATKLVTNRFGLTAPLGELKPNAITIPREPIKLRFKATDKINGKTIYKSTLVTNRETDQLETASTQAVDTHNRDATSLTRSRYYKTIESPKNFSSTANFPEFNIGKKLINPSDFSRLKSMAILNLEKPEDYLKLHEVIENSDHLKDGTLNIEKITCSRVGKATVVCENEIQKELLKGILEFHDFHPNDAQIRNNSFAIFGIPKTKGTDAIIKQLVKRDKRFKRDEFKAKERFSINDSKDAITFSCCESLTMKITSKPYTFLGTSRYKLNKFADLIQCFKCAKFGHTAAKCASKKICCPNCAEAHPLDKCTHNYTPKCGNCSSVKVGQTNHSSWDVRCPYRLLWIKKQKEWLQATPPQYST